MAINLIDGFHLGNSLPIDDRYVQSTVTARDGLDAGLLYAGLKTYVTATDTWYTYDGTAWKTLAEDAAISGALSDLEDSIMESIGDITAAGVHFKGGIDASTTHYTPKAEIGDIYVVSTAGTIDGVTVEAGDMLIANANVAAATSANVSTIVGNWTFVQANISVMAGATASAAGASGYVPTPGAGANTKYLRGDATWSAIAISEVTNLQTTLNDKVGKLSAAANNQVILGGTTATSIKSSGMTVGGSTFATTPSATALTNESAVADYVSGATSNKIDGLADAAEDKVILGGETGTTVKASTSTIGGTTFASTPSATALTNESAVATYVTNALTAKTNKLSAAANNKVILGGSTANDIKASSVGIGGTTFATTPSSALLPTEASTATYVTGAIANKIDGLSAAAENKIILGGSTKTTVKASSVGVGGTTYASTPSTTLLPTEASTAAYVTDALTAKTNKLSAAAENKVILGGATANDIKASTSTIGGSTFATTPSATALTNESAVATYVTNALTAKMNKLSAAASNKIILGGSTANDVKASTATLGGSTFAATPAATTVTNEAAVAAYVAAQSAGGSKLYSFALTGATGSGTNVGLAAGQVVEEIVILTTTAYASNAKVTISNGSTTILDAFPIGKMGAGNTGMEVIYKALTGANLTFTITDNSGNAGAATVYLKVSSPAAIA